MMRCDFIDNLTQNSETRIDGWGGATSPLCPSQLSG